MSRADTRTVDPYDRSERLVDSRGPRFNHSVTGPVLLVAYVLDVEWLVAVLAAQLFLGLSISRRLCLPCFFYFEVIQPRWGEGPLEDDRPPRAAGFMGLSFLTGATVAFMAGAPNLGWALVLVVSGMAGFAAVSGICIGCQLYLQVAKRRDIRTVT